MVIKAKGTLAIPTAHAYRMLLEPAIRTQWDEKFKDFEVVETISENEDITYYWVKAPIMVTNRDFLVNRKYKKDVAEYNYVIYTTSIEHPSKPVTSKRVRGSTIDGVCALKILGEDSCEMSIISQINLNGNVPKFLVNSKAVEGTKQVYTTLVKKHASLKSALK